MALINCEECGKEISNKSTSCINCGAPIEKELEVLENTTQIKSTYKKFDFDGIKEKINDLEFLEKYNKEKINDSQYGIATGFIFAIIFGVVTCLDIWLLFRFLAGLLSIIFILIFFKSLFVGTFTKKTSSISDSVICDKIYKDVVYLFSISPPDLEYEAISFIKADSEEELIEEAFILKADAIINLNLNEYSTSKVSSSFNGIGAQRTISTNLKHHQNWNGTAIKINSNEYHSIDLDKLLIMS